MPYKNHWYYMLRATKNIDINQKLILEYKPKPNSDVNDFIFDKTILIE